MKKLLLFISTGLSGKSTLILLFSTACILFAIASNAQNTILFEDFASGTLPTNWTISKNISSVGWQFGNSTQAIEIDEQGDTIFAPPPHGNFACDLDYNDNGGSPYTSDKADSDRLITPSLNLSSYSTVFVKFAAYFLEYYYVGTPDTEKLTFEASLDKGKTWSTVGEVYGNGGTWQDLYFNASAYAGDTGVQFCFDYDDGDTILVGASVDSLLIFEPSNYTVSVVSQNLNNNYYQKNSSNVISGSLYNYGSQTISTMDLDWSVNGGPVNKTPLSSLNIVPLTYYNYTSAINWVPTSAGNAILKIWADSINGNIDQSPSTDTLTANLVVLDSLVKKMVMLEEFGNASCNPCAEALPSFDSVVLNSKNFANVVRYHVNWPGEDLMNVETQSQVVVRQDYYDVTGVPQFFMDGATDDTTGGDPGLIHSPDIYGESLSGSPIRISGSYTYDISSHHHTINATIKSFAAFPANTLRVYAVIIDSVAYSKDQSQESIAQYYFPEVAEEILPSSAGGVLGAFDTASSQTVNYTWDQTHRVSADTSTIYQEHFSYDSGSFAVVIFVQNYATGEIYQSGFIPANVVSAGINELSSGLTKAIAYPNPFNTTINLSMNLEKNEQVMVTLSDILGREILAKDEGFLNPGDYKFMYDASSLSSGIYFLKIQTADGEYSLKVIKSD